jgi:hypothetical protein
MGGICIDRLISRLLRITITAISVAMVSVAITGTCAYTFEAQQLYHEGEPVIHGDTGFQSRIHDALDYLEDRYPDNYRETAFWLTEVRPTDACTRVNGLGVCYISKKDASDQRVWLAGVLIHEAQHVEDDYTYFIEHPYTVEESELRALRSQSAFLASAYGWSPEQRESWIDYWMDNRYWERAKY